MRVHKYVVNVCESILDFTHGMYHRQTRLYIPDKAVIGFRNIEEGVDFFSDNPESLAEGEKMLHRIEHPREHFKSEFLDEIEEAEKAEEEYIQYIGFVELPDEIVSKAISSGRLMNKSKKSLQTIVKVLNDLMANSLI